MKANELRIGNAILINGEVCNNIGYGIITDCYRKQKGLVSEYLDTLIFKPIPLTEEWLLKFGFENYDSLKFSINDLLVVDLHDFTFGVNRFDVCWLDNKNTIHVHQLQNLYFALTGEELKLQNNEII